MNDLREKVGWGGASWFMVPAFEVGAGVLFLATVGDDAIGCGSAIVSGELGYIGSMISVAHRRREGIGRAVFTALMDWLTGRGATRIDLGATPDGRPLYELFGFRARWEDSFAVGTGPFPEAQEVPPIRPDDWAGIGELDRRASGGERHAYLGALAAQPRTTSRVVREGGTVTGFGMSSHGRIGPLVAANDEVASRLVGALAAASGEASLRVNCGGPGKETFWAGLGFEVEPNDTRMTWGAPPNDDPSLSYALISGGAG